MWNRRSLWVLGICVLTTLSCTRTLGHLQGPSRPLDVPYVPTPNEVVEEMLRLTRVTRNDVVYDLGCGDGRIVITAVRRHGARGVGVDIDPERIRESNENAKAAGVTDRVQFFERDLFEMDISEATVVTLYLLPRINLKLRPKLFEELKPGTRIVSHDFDMGEWRADRTVRVQGPHREHTLYYWVLPASVAGSWRISSPAFGNQGATLQLTQEFQNVRGTIQAAGQTTTLSDVQLTGDQIRFTAARTVQGRSVPLRFTGRVTGETIQGRLDGADRREWTAKRQSRPEQRKETQPVSGIDDY